MNEKCIQSVMGQSERIRSLKKKLQNKTIYNIYCIEFFLILDCEAIGTAATPGLLCQPRVIVKMIVEKQMEM
jgi:hypothetical protein